MKQESDGWATTYYDLPEGATTLQDLIEDRRMNYAVGNIFKAAFRLGRKRGTDELYDLKKIKWFVGREIARVEREQAQASLPVGGGLRDPMNVHVRFIEDEEERPNVHEHMRELRRDPNQ